MRRMLLALLAFLETFEKKGAPVPPAAQGPGMPTEEVEAYWRQAVAEASKQAYITGHHAGELAGRQALAAELEAQFTPEGAREFGPEEARLVALRQTH